MLKRYYKSYENCRTQMLGKLQVSFYLRKLYYSISRISGDQGPKQTLCQCLWAPKWMLPDPLFKHLSPRPRIFGERSRGAVTTGRAHGNLKSSNHFQTVPQLHGFWLSLELFCPLGQWVTFLCCFLQSHCCIPRTCNAFLFVHAREPFILLSVFIHFRAEKNSGNHFESFSSYHFPFDRTKVS